MSRVVHFEIPAIDGEKTVQFYKDVFGWEFQRWGEEQYWLASTGDEREPGINGAVTICTERNQTVLNTISTVDLELTQKRIIENGGTIELPKTAVPGVGWLIYFKDIDGNKFGVMEYDPQAA